MSRANQLRAELELAELEERLVAAKDDDDVDPDAYRVLKDEVRAARAAHREAREG